MIRLLLLTIPALSIFVGFAMPFFVEGISGFVIAVILIVFGSLVFWLCEIRTKHSLDEETEFNKFLKSDGDDLIERK
ncbi:MAG: hypothetical protein ACRBHB_00215 [Arenicella sp.]